MANILSAINRLLESDDATLMGEAPMREPVFEPDPTATPELSNPVQQMAPQPPAPNPNLDAIRKLADPSAIASAEERLADTQSGAGLHLANIMQYFPRLRQFSSMIKGSRSKNAKAAQDELSKRYDAMKFAQTQDNWEKEYGLKSRDQSNKDADERRKSADHAALTAMMDDPRATELFIDSMGQQNPLWADPERKQKLMLLDPRKVFELGGKVAERDKAVQDFNVKIEEIKGRQSVADTAAGARDRATQAKLEVERGRASRSSPSNLGINEATKKLGEEYGKHLAGGGFAGDESTLKTAKSVIDALEKGNVEASGQYIGNLPKWARDTFNPKGSQVENMARSVVLPMVKKFFPGATSNWESETALELVFNPRFDESQNAALMKSWVDKIEAEIANKKQAFKQFEAPATKPPMELSDDEALEIGRQKGWIK